MHADTLQSMYNLALALTKQGEHDAAEDLFLMTLERRRQTLGEEHPDTLASMHDLGSVYHDQDRYAEAEPLD